jgi:signal peptide peptidase SppA
MQEEMQDNQNNNIPKHFPTFKKIFKKRNFNIKKFIKNLFILIAILTMISFWCEQVYLYNSDDAWEDDEYMDEDLNGEEYPENCNVSGNLLRGDLVTYIDENSEYLQTSSEDIVYFIEDAEKNDQIKAILLEVDSYGGGPVADEEVANALKRVTKPTVVLIRTAGLSSAYYASTGANIIFASKDSDVGSIGVTMSYIDNARQNQKDGLTFNQLSSGKFKDIMNYDKPLTLAERNLLMRDVEIMNENFIEAVAENRNLDIEKVRQLADGSSMLGEMALDNGLIDRIGGQHEVEEYLAELLGEDIEVCW